MHIQSKIKSYDMHMVSDWERHSNSIKEKCSANRCYFLIDEAVYKLFKPQIDTFIQDQPKLIIPADENNKEYLKLAEYMTWLTENGFNRRDLLVVFGGGVLQDIGGFIASILYRGIKWVFFPTTLLAQADSCIGSKTSINFGTAKNLVGTFYPPNLILNDSRFLETLPDNQFNSGLGEIIKFHILSDDEGYERLTNFIAGGNPRTNTNLQNIIESTLQIKKGYFEEDEFDTGRRNLLNYGHCFGHALESATDFQIPHGEAVLVGMGFANILANKRGLMKAAMFEHFNQLFFKFYPVMDFSQYSVEDIIHFLKKDKKRVTKDLTMIIGSKVGDFKKVDDVTEKEIIDCFDIFKETYPQKAAEFASSLNYQLNSN